MNTNEQANQVQQHHHQRNCQKPATKTLSRANNMSGQ